MLFTGMTGDNATGYANLQPIDDASSQLRFSASFLFSFSVMLTSGQIEGHDESSISRVCVPVSFI